jgi:hypothetical protein
MTAQVTSQTAEVAELEAQQALRKEEMAFYAELDKLYQNLSVLQAAMESAYVSRNKLET